MPIPYSTERVVDMILRSLRASGVIADDISTQSIREVANNSTDAQLDALAASLNYGGVSGTDAIFALEDFDLVIDSDNSQSGTGPWFQQFRVERGSNLLPITNPADHLFSVGNFKYTNFPVSYLALATIGPIPPIASGGDYPGMLEIGWHDSELKAFTQVFSALTATKSGAGTRITSSNYLELSGEPDIFFTYNHTSLRTIRGGWQDLSTEARFAVGDFSDSDKSFLFEVAADTGGSDVLTIRPQSTDFTKIFFRGSNDAVLDPIQVVINGKVDETWGDPDNFGNPTLLVLGNAAAEKRVVRFHSQVNNWNTSDPVFHFSTEHGNGAPYHYIFRITRAGGVGVFNIDSLGDANLGIGGAYNSAGADVAEWLPSVKRHPVGTVLVIDNDGSLIASKTIEDPAVAGVVSDTPAVKMGSPDDHGGVKPEGKALVAAVGRVPVRCTTLKGPIRPGDRLVSGLGGCAVKASDDAPSAAILGKSLGYYEGPEEGTVEALVSW